MRHQSKTTERHENILFLADVRSGRGNGFRPKPYGDGDRCRPPAVEAATVVLQTADSTYIDATLTDSLGVFRFGQRPERYRLIVEHLIYNTCIREGSGADADTLVLTPRDYALDEVTVRGERPLVKVEGSRLTYDVAQIAASRLVTNAYEALLQLPGVVERDGVPALAGTGSLSIILNGKPSSMTAEQLISLLKGHARLARGTGGGDV